MLELSIFRVACVSAKKLNRVGDSLVENQQGHFWKMAAEQGRTQWNGRSDATSRDPHSSPCTGLKVYKSNNYIGKNNPNFIMFVLKQDTLVFTPTEIIPLVSLLFLVIYYSIANF